MHSLVRLGFVPRGYDLGLLILRVWTGISLFLNHGLGKITGFSGMQAHFFDPFHIGSRWSLLLSVCAETVCALLVVLGLATRWAALVIAIDLGVAFVLFHKFQLMGEHSGELAWVYFGAALTLFVAGGGRFSLDGKA
jgi:putative oxidoreductase